MAKLKGGCQLSIESGIPQNDADRPLATHLEANAVQEDTASDLRRVDPVVRKRIQEWATRLIDLSRRNRLLYYRATKRTTLRLVSPDPTVIARSLLAEGSWRFYEPPNETSGGRAGSIGEALSVKPASPREIVTHHLDPQEMHRSLEVISRRANAEFHDRGTHVLQLGWGMVRWQDDHSNESARSPLLLIPIVLSRASIKEPWTMRMADDDPLLNPALRVKLHTEFGLQLPEITDFGDADLVALAKSVADRIPSDWDVEPYAVLGIFGFAKEAIYRDLVDHIALVAEDAQVQTLAHGAPMGAMRDNLAISVPSAGALDDVQDPATSYSVLDADSTQREAIQAAIAGLSFVMHGPPGTGKSQTIANIIAEFMGRGRSVLFVSEKMAALEVVANRLGAAGLADMVLELHSHKASRKKVALELARVLDEDVLPQHQLSTAEFDLLRASRSRLNAYIDALHLVRQPLGRSVRAVLSELAGMVGVPALPGPELEASASSAVDLLSVETIVGRLAASWAPKDPEASFTWRNVALERFTSADRMQVGQLLERVKDAVGRVSALERELLPVLAIGQPKSEDDRHLITHIGEVLRSHPVVPRSWLADASMAEHQRQSRRWEQYSLERTKVREALVVQYGANWDRLQPEHVASLETLSSGLAAALGLEDLDSIEGIPRLPDLLLAAELLDTHAAEATVAYRTAAQRLGLLPRLHRLSDVRRAASACELSQSHHRPPATWLSPQRRKEARTFFEELGGRYEQYQSARERLSAEYDIGSLDSIDLAALINRFAAHYGKWFSIVRPSYRADRRFIRSIRRDGRLSVQAVADLQAIAALHDQRHAIERDMEHERRILGPLSGGVDTNLAAVESALGVADGLGQVYDIVSDWDAFASATTAGSPDDAGMERLGIRLSEISTDLSRAVVELASGSPKRIASWLAASPEDVATAIGSAIQAGRALLPLVAEMDRLRLGPVESVESAVRELTRRGAIAQHDARLGLDEPSLRRLFGERFVGWDTDWEAIHADIEWSIQLRAIYGGGGVPASLADVIDQRSDAQLPFERYGQVRDELRAATQALMAIFDDEHQAHFRRGLLGDPAAAVNLVDELQATVEQISTWIEHRDAVRIACEAGWTDFVLRASGTVPADTLLPAARRAWLERWVESLIGGDDLLSPFSREEHERLSRTFKQLDEASILTARERLLANYADSKPRNFAIQGGEEAVVRREAARKRGHIPVRKLIAGIPQLLPRIKPCLMMSPLSVSHFLPADLRFDLVIFDEASQVPPEDAINCVYRGAQLIVAGDEHQLPPTDFFHVAAESEEDAESDIHVDDFESVLDVCRASGLPTKSLRWHYRSRHDELIAFSNHHFYANSLVTFPAPIDRLPEMGVQFVHVPDGVFDRGRSSKNLVEASRVVDIVVRLIREERRNSIGVVAFSVAQQEAIQDELERRRRLDTELDALIDGDRLSGLFIKNLETVQGDERDIIVFSVGYGRDLSGRFLMNFGPLNRQGGSRRLNVAVTRARERVIVVSSVRAIDFGAADATGVVKSEGPRLLQAYLDYAERGPETLAAHLSESGGDFDSEFEREVAGVVRSMGFEIVPQVGTSGYRIDIGVRSSRAPGRFVLGIECDGAMYHSAKTARDRDRLRQSVLERLGWRIHRVWSQDWFQHRASEIDRLREAIDEAERDLGIELSSERAASDIFVLPSGTADVDEAQPVRSRVVRYATDHSLDSHNVPWAVPYSVSQVAEYPGWADFNDWSMRGEHSRRITALVAAEGPLHRDYIATRLARSFGLARTGARMQESVRAAINQAQADGAVDVRGPFVWPKGTVELKVRLPVAGSGDTQRGIEEIPPEEVDMALLRTVEAAMSIEPDHLVTRVARTLGYERTGGRIGELLRRRIDANIDNGKLAQEALRLVLKATLPPLERSAQPSLKGPNSDAQYRPGERLRHPRYGEGVVRASDGTRVTVAFGDIIKEFAAEQTPFERLNG